MRFFWGGHFEFSKSAILNFFLLHLCEKSSPFIWGIIFFCSMDGFFRILEKTSSELICTRLYLLTVLRYVMTNVHSVYKTYIHTSKVCSNWHWDFRLVSSNQSHFLFPKRLDVKCVVQCDTTQKTQFYHTLH